MRLPLKDIGRLEETRSQATTTWQIFSKEKERAALAEVQYTGASKW